MKKILSVLVLLAMVVLLVACSHDDSSSKSSPESMDGIYYHFYYKKNGKAHIYKPKYIEITGDTVVYHNPGGTHGKIDLDSKEIKFGSKTTYSYTYKNGVLELDNRDSMTFVKKDSLKYRKMIKDGADVFED